MDGMSIREMVDQLTQRVEHMQERLSRVEARINMALGGVAVIGITAIINVVTNVLQVRG